MVIYNWYQDPLKYQDGKPPDEIPGLKKQSREGGSRYQKLDIQSRLESPTQEVDTIQEDFLPKSKKEERRVEPVILVPITTDSSLVVILY